MPIDRYKVAPMTLTGDMAQDTMHACAHFFAQNFRKKKFNQNTVTLVYNAYKAMHWPGASGDLREKFQEEIEFLAKNNPEGLEKRLGTVLKKMADDSAKGAATETAKLQAAVDLAAVLGIEPEVYFNSDPNKTVDFYGMSGLKRPEYPANALKLKLLMQSSTPKSFMDIFTDPKSLVPKLVGFEFPIEYSNGRPVSEDVEAIKRHKDIFAKKIPAISLPFEKEAGSQKQSSAAHASPITPSQALQVAPRNAPQLPSQRPAPVLKNAADKKPTPDQKPEPAAKASETPKPSIFEGIGSGIDAIGQAMNQSGLANQGGFLGGLMGFVGKLLGFAKQIISWIAPVVEPIMGIFNNLFGGAEAGNKSEPEKTEQPGLDSESDEALLREFENPFEFSSRTGDASKREPTIREYPSESRPDLAGQLRHARESLEASAHTPHTMRLLEAPVRGVAQGSKRSSEAAQQSRRDQGLEPGNPEARPFMPGFEKARAIANAAPLRPAASPTADVQSQFEPGRAHQART